jgi:hypothetical protein
MFYGGIIFLFAAKYFYYHDFDRLNEADYLANLRHSNTFGCRTFEDRQADVLVIGDSHNYAGWDYETLARFFPGQKISACTMGGFYFETVGLIVSSLKQSSHIPKRIIYGTSPRQFAVFPDKQKALTVHEVYMSPEYTLRNFVKDLLIHLQTGKKVSLVHTQSGVEDKLYRLNFGSIESLSDEGVEAYIEKYPNASWQSWSRVTKQWQYTIDIEKQIASFCSFVNARGIVLDVVHIPESPVLVGIYGKKIMSDYQRILEKFESCGRVIFGEAEDYGLGNRHFVNRRMDVNFPYEAIGNLEKIPQEKDFDYDYDLDHLNFVGARVFTSAVGPKLSGSRIARP